MIIDFDSHLREGYFMDEVYRLEGPFERFRPVKMNDGRTHNTKFIHSLDPISPQGHAAHRHPYIYDPKTNWRGGDIAARQVGGHDMARRSAARATGKIPRTFPTTRLPRRSASRSAVIRTPTASSSTASITSTRPMCSAGRPTAARRWWRWCWAACWRNSPS